MITVRIIYNDPEKEDDIKDVTSVDDVCLDGVKEVKPIRTEKAA